MQELADTRHSKADTESESDMKYKCIRQSKKKQVKRKRKIKPLKHKTNP